MLCSRPDTWYVHGPLPWRRDLIEKHTVLPPMWTEGWGRYLLMRHPYDRVPSLYAHHIQYGLELPPFKHWLHHCLPAVLEDFQFESPCAYWCPSPVGIIHLESLLTDLHTLFGICPSEAQENVSIVPRPSLDSDDRYLIRRLYAPDFKLGGYDA